MILRVLWSQLGLLKAHELLHLYIWAQTSFSLWIFSSTWESSLIHLKSFNYFNKHYYVSSNKNLIILITEAWAVFNLGRLSVSLITLTQSFNLLLFYIPNFLLPCHSIIICSVILFFSFTNQWIFGYESGKSVRCSLYLERKCNSRTFLFHSFDIISVFSSLFDFILALIFSQRYQAYRGSHMNKVRVQVCYSCHLSLTFISTVILTDPLQFLLHFLLLSR